MRNIFVVGNGLGYANWMQGSLVKNMDDADLVVFTGGEDVSPQIYGEPKGSHTFNNLHRDIFEKKMFEEAVQKEKHIIGICRGSQLSCVLSGGRLVQHQENPAYIHPIETFDGKEILITSTHHQAQFPYNLKRQNYKLIAWTENLSPFHLDGEDEELNPQYEAEIVYYPKTKALAIQGHPEMIWGDRGRYEKTFTYLHALLDNHLNNKI